MQISNASLRSWHRRLALVLGVLIVFQGLTGAIAQYRFWLLQASDPETYAVTPSGVAATPGGVITAIEQQLPGFVPAHAMYPAASSPGTAVVVMGGRDPSGMDMSRIATVDQYTGRVMDEVSASAGWVGLATALHKWLLFGTTGRVVLTVIGLGTFSLMVLGLTLWWRTRRADGRVSPVARLHRTTGAVAGGLIAIVALTGTALNLSTWAEKANGNSVTKSNMDAAMAAGHASHAVPKVGVDEAYRIALTRVGPQHLAAFSPAGGHARHHWFAFNSRQLARTDVLVSGADGSIVGVYPAGVLTGGSGVRQWLFPVHSGYVIGPVGGAIMTVLGLSLSVWFATGIIIWRRARPRRRSAGVGAQAAV